MKAIKALKAIKQENMLEPHYFEGKIEAGCDEAGRGCLAGSVYAAAVILPPGYNNELLNDTKKHREGIRLHGISPYHRKSYNLTGEKELFLDF